MTKYKYVKKNSPAAQMMIKITAIKSQLFCLWINYRGNTTKIWKAMSNVLNFLVKKRISLVKSPPNHTRIRFDSVAFSNWSCFILLWQCDLSLQISKFETTRIFFSKWLPPRRRRQLEWKNCSVFFEKSKSWVGHMPSLN